MFETHTIGGRGGGGDSQRTTIYIYMYIYICKPKNQKTKEPKNKKTKNTEPKKQNTKTVPAFSVELWFFGFLVSVVGWFFTDTFGGLKLDTPEKAD